MHFQMGWGEGGEGAIEQILSKNQNIILIIENTHKYIKNTIKDLHRKQSTILGLSL